MTDQLRLSKNIPFFKKTIPAFNFLPGSGSDGEKTVAGYTWDQLERKLREDQGLGDGENPIIPDAVIDDLTSENTKLAPLNAWKSSDGRWHLYGYLRSLFKVRGVVSSPSRSEPARPLQPEPPAKPERAPKDPSNAPDPGGADRREERENNKKP